MRATRQTDALGGRAVGAEGAASGPSSVAALGARPPVLSVIVPTFNNVDGLRHCLHQWRAHADGAPVEVIVIVDGCHDATAGYLHETCRTEWGGRHLRWCLESDVHELRCTNRGFREAAGSLLLTWQDDMQLRSSWLVDEIIRTFHAYTDLGVLALGRGLTHTPVDEPILTTADLINWRRLQSTIGTGPGNWLRLTEVDSAVRPWVVRRECLDVVGPLDEAFCPTEWDEIDLCFRIRRAGWKIAAHGYERLGAYTHAGSATLKEPSSAYRAGVLRNGQLFHRRWGGMIRAAHGRRRKTWPRRSPGLGWWHTLRRGGSRLVGRAREAAATAGHGSGVETSDL